MRPLAAVRSCEVAVAPAAACGLELEAAVRGRVGSGRPAIAPSTALDLCPGS